MTPDDSDGTLSSIGKRCFWASDAGLGNTRPGSFFVKDGISVPREHMLRDIVTFGGMC